MDTPENGSLILIEEVQSMLEKGASPDDMLSMVLRLHMYEIKRSNAQQADIEKLKRHDPVEWALTKPKQSIPAAMAFTAIFISESRHWLIEQAKNILGLK